MHTLSPSHPCPGVLVSWEAALCCFVGIVLALGVQIGMDMRALIPRASWLNIPLPELCSACSSKGQCQSVQVLMDVYGKLVKADEFIAVSKGEVYFRTLRGCANGRPWWRMRTLVCLDFNALKGRMWAACWVVVRAWLRISETCCTHQQCSQLQGSLVKSR